MEHVSSSAGAPGHSESDVVALSCASSVNTGADPAPFLVSRQSTAPLSLLTSIDVGSFRFHTAHSTSACTSQAIAAFSGARTSTTHARRSKPPESKTVGSAGFHSAACTFPSWCLKTCCVFCVEMSHTRTVWSADAEASTLRYCAFQDKPRTASEWPSVLSAGFFFRSRDAFFFPAFFDAFFPPFRGASSSSSSSVPPPPRMSSSSYPPSVATGSTASITSRSQISMPGYIVPTATRLARPSRPSVGQSIHDMHSGNAGRSKSWWQYRLPSSVPFRTGSSYTYTSRCDTSSSVRAASITKSVPRTVKSSG